MIVTREAQERILSKYIKNHTTQEVIGFMDGINATLELINKIHHDNKTI